VDPRLAEHCARYRGVEHAAHADRGAELEMETEIWGGYHFCCGFLVRIWEQPLAYSQGLLTLA
jgi:hypothetical protein